MAGHFPAFTRRSPTVRDSYSAAVACLFAMAVGAAVAVAGPKWGGLAIGLPLLLGTALAWVWRRPDPAVAAIALLIPLQVRLNLPGAGALAVGFLAISGLAAIVLYRGLVERPGTPVGASLAGAQGRPQGMPLPWGMLLFIVAALVSLWAAPDTGEAGRRALYLGWFVLLFWLVPRCLDDERALRRVLTAIVAATVIAAIVGLVQFALQFVVGTLPLYGFWVYFVTPILEGERVATAYQQTGTNWLLFAGGRPLMRAVGTFSGPPDAAQYLGVCLPLALAMLMSRPRVRFGQIAQLSILALFLALTFSRQAWVGMLLALPAMYLAAWRATDDRRPTTSAASPLHRRLGYLLTSLVVLLAVGLGSVVGLQSSVVGRQSPVIERLLSIGDRSDTSNLNRFETWAQALELAEEHPVIGAGLGNYATAAGERHGAYSHNTYLDVLVETGPLGLLGLLALLGWGASAAWGVARRAATPELRAAGVGFVGAVVALAAIFFFDDAFYFPRAGQAFWLLLGLIAAALRMKG